MDLDLWGCLRRKKHCLISEEIRYLSLGSQFTVKHEIFTFALSALLRKLKENTHENYNWAKINDFNDTKSLPNISQKSIRLAVRKLLQFIGIKIISWEPAIL